MAASQGIFALMTIWNPTFKEALDWLKFAYIENWMGDYVMPASTFIIHSAIMGEGELFTSFYRHLQKIYPGAYAHSTLFLGPDYPSAPTIYLP